MSEDNSGPAFPSSNCPDTGHYAEGMTLRDYFAAKALPAMLSIVALDPKAMLAIPDSSLAKRAYNLADAMLKERGA